ncbi:DUF4136 domain-containing protein [Algoriphagus sp. NG3]|uniref:DUF4136 domain-containing protein n=1 Tax=Algoriphagus sp. NG3 TaxID=3097546 RepID=UPI002A83E950|nr:DUF4136 domain-containing protein [Algoriphagus sp. NG3]WPR77874.1 DUF4136 domain-containing protein [Algoriphagus sp. NG3]
MKRHDFCPLFLLVILVSSCTTSRISVEQEKYGNFKLQDYKTFSFLEVDQSKTGVPVFTQAIDYLKQEITTQMASRGLSEDPNDSELKINLGLVIENKEQTRETNLATDPFMYSGQRNYIWKSEEVVVNRYKEGTLTMHLVDSETNAAVWIGTISDIIPTKQEKKQAAIEVAVSSLFEKLDSVNNSTLQQ